MTYGQIVRICVGLSLLGLAGYVIWPHVVHVIGREAVVNARLIVLKSPIEGKVISEPPPVGREVDAGAVVAVIENDRQDTSFLNELRTERSTLHERVQALTQQESELEATRRALTGRIAEFRKARQRMIDREIEQLEAAIRAAHAILQEREQNLSRRKELLSAGHAARSSFEEAESSARVARERLSEAELALSRRRAERDAVQRGVFVDGSQNDVPYSLQRIDEIDLRLQDLRARRREYEIRIAEIDKQMAVEEERLTSQRTSVQRAPRQAVVWQRSVSRGVDVVIGSELAQLLDCEDLFLEVNLDERNASRIQPGQSSRIRLVGSDEELRGTVQTMRGNTVSARDALAVAQLDRTAESQITVTVAIDRASLGAVQGTFCGVGRTALVTFDRPLSFTVASTLRRPSDVR